MNRLSNANDEGHGRCTMMIRSTLRNVLVFTLTRDPQYREMGEKIFNDFVQYCRTDSGYAALSDMGDEDEA